MSNIYKHIILVILGPTSSGKSDIAIKLAKKFNGEIISADSRQIYRGMDIGTGKISRDKRFDLEELQKGSILRNFERQRKRERSNLGKKVEPWTAHGIPHHMLDIVSPRTDFNVAKFKKQTERIINNILKRGKLPIICGGTGFWIKAIVDNVNFPEVKPDWKMRKKLEKYSAIKIFAILKKLDPLRAKNIDRKNKVRLIRAIEICKVIGKVPAAAGIPSPSALLRINSVEGSRQNIRYNFLQIGLKLSREKLYSNIERRVKTRFRQGMILEVENLHKQGLSWKKIQSFGLAYYWIPLYLQNKISKSKLIEKVIQAEINYAKRQRTWFKRDKRIEWLKNYSQIVKSVQGYMRNENTSV